ncbi:MAG: hypothetical protein KDK50_06960 [Chlamydiia bacterium]|nr:hypothetical protein [Chlamydiia bacterium]
MRSGKVENSTSIVDEGHLYLRNAQFEEFTKWFGQQSTQFWVDHEKAFLDGLLYPNVFEGVLEIKASKVFAIIYPSCKPVKWCAALDAYVEKVKQPEYHNESTLEFAIYLFNEGLNLKGKELAEAFIQDANFQDKVTGYQEFLEGHSSEKARWLLTMFTTSSTDIDDLVGLDVRAEGSGEEDLSELY